MDDIQRHLIRKVAQHNYVDLQVTPFTGKIQIDYVTIARGGVRIRQYMVGPFRVDSPLLELQELLIMLVWETRTDGYQSIQMLVRDAEGDFINSTAHPLNTKLISFTHTPAKG